jgi:hypothetical protein
MSAALSRCDARTACRRAPKTPNSPPVLGHLRLNLVKAERSLEAAVGVKKRCAVASLWTATGRLLHPSFRLAA